MREQKVLVVNLKSGQKLIIPALNIDYVESINKDACRIYFHGNTVAVERDYDWMVKFLAKDYDRSDANEY